MSDAPLILGVSGLRGIVGESLTPEVAVRYAGAFGSWLKQRSSMHSVVVARDGRAGGELIYHSAIAGLLGVGMDVRAIGVVTTPTAGLQVDGGIDGAIVVTASHNPGEWNGLKLLVCEQSESVGGVGRAPTLQEANEIIELYQAQSYAWATNSEAGRFCDKGAQSAIQYHCDLIEPSIHEVLGESDGVVEVSKLRVVLDSVNSSGSVGAEKLLQRFGVHTVQLAGDDSGIFPHTPEPTKENLSGNGGLCDAVPGLKADVGFAQDPDADRLAIVDERGKYIGEEYTLVLCAIALLEAGFVGQPKFVVNLSTSRMIDDVAKKYNATVIRTAVGEANVVESMVATMEKDPPVFMGGEGNGGVIWPRVGLVRDSLSGMALVLSLMARTGKTVSELVEMVNGLGPTDEVKASGYTIIKKKSALAKKSDADPVVEHLRGIYAGQGECRVDLQDGIRIDWDAKGVWAHVRASNTEPIMRVIVEAPSSAEAESVAAAIDGQISSMGS